VPRIATAIQSYGVRESGKIEILFGEAKHPLPFRHFRLDEVRHIGDKVVKTEVVTEQVMTGWEEYADLLLLAAVALAESEPSKAEDCLQKALQMWDGRGLKDRVVTKNNRYATYKLALALLASSKLGLRPPAHEAILERLLAQQNTEGGWITDYDTSGKPRGRANVETTSMAILALDVVARNRQATQQTGKEGQGSPQRVADPQLRQELLKRMAVDQQARKHLLDLMAQQNGPDPNGIQSQIVAAKAKLQKVDKENAARMKEIVRQHGWPGKTLVGSDGTQAAWLLVQHADPDLAFQKQCLTLITEAVKKGEVPAQQMAYLTDRVRVAEKQKQVYGTQFEDLEPFPIEDEANVDKRRQGVNLPPLAEYRKSIEAMYGLSTDKAAPRRKPAKNRSPGANDGE
jgi:hypothetical protein